ncbi:MAG: glycosyltransferase family 4 protein, partial [Pseudomonadota bacterium]
NAIVSVTESFVPHITDRLKGPKPLHVIKNGVDLSLFNRSISAEDAKRQLGLDGKYVAAYVGTHGLAHGLDTVLDAAERLTHDPRIVFLLVGDGAERVRLLERAKQMQLANIRILGQRPKSDMPMVWAATDASIIHLKRSDTFKKVLPSKMFEAMAMQCPIVLGVEGEARALLDDANAGIGITPENADELANAVAALADDPHLCETLAASGSSYVRTHFDRSRLARAYLDVLSAVSRRNAEPTHVGSRGLDRGSESAR